MPVTRLGRIAFALVSLWALASEAGDGVREISQACAAGPGCFPGDAPGFPVVIDHSTSVRLVGELIVPSADTTAISIEADDVALDLNGFAIRGPTACSGTPAVCVPVGSGSGVFSLRDASVVHGGTVTGMGGSGVLLLGAAVRVERVRAIGNGRTGIEVGLGAVIANCAARANGESGVRMGGDGVIVATRALGNGFDGFDLADAAAWSSSASGNGFDGIDGSTVTVGLSSLSGNGVDGADLSTAALALLAIFGNAQRGFDALDPFAAGDSAIRANAVRGGDASGGGLRGDVFSGSPTTFTDGLEIGTNLCNGNTSCP